MSNLRKGKPCPTCGHKVSFSLDDAALELAASRGSVTPEMLVEEEHCTIGTAYNVLSKLAAAGKLFRCTRRGRYVLEAARDALEAVGRLA